MTSLVDVVTEVGNLSRIEQDLSEAVTSRLSATSGEQDGNESSDEDGDLPTKLRNKSKREIAEMYQNLETLHGRTANDLGQQRQLTDRLLDLKRNTDLETNSPEKKPVKVDISSAELLEKPTEALERFASARESALVSQVNDRLNRLEQATIAREFAQKHPDVQDVAKSPDFVEWVKQSPTRSRAANLASQGDYGAADDLITEFKSGRSQKTEDTKKVQSDSLRAAREASLESGASNSVETGNKKSGKVYSRADLMRLKLENPDKYYDESYQTEILSAYAEGRVK